MTAKYWLVAIAAEDGEMDAMQSSFDEWAESNDYVIGVTMYGTLDHRLIVGDKIPGEIAPHTVKAGDTVSSLIEALEKIDPTGERKIFNDMNVLLAKNGEVFLIRKGE